MILNVASLQYGVIFKKAFGQIDIFKGFVKDFIGIELEINQVETEKTFSEQIGPVRAKFDLYAEDKKNRIIVEVQHNRYTDHYDRFLYYHNVAINDQVQSYQDYRIRKQVYTIVVLTSGDATYQEPWLQSDFTLHNLEGVRFPEFQHKLIYLCPKYVNDNVPQPYREWLMGIKDTLDNQVESNNYHNPLLEQIFHTIQQDGLTPTERAAIKDEYNLQQFRAEGKAEGKAEGVEEGTRNTVEQVLISRLGIMPDPVHEIWGKMRLFHFEKLLTLLWQLDDWGKVEEQLSSLLDEK